MMLRPNLTIGAARPWVHGDEELLERVRLVLETRPGQLPWRPEFGCDLESLVGQPATSGRLTEVRWRVERALARWLPDVNVERCVVRAIPHDSPGLVAATTPVAESALLGLGTQADLEVSLELTGPQGALTVQAQLTP